MGRHTTEPDSGAIHDGGETLLQRSELVEQRRLEFQGKLDLGNSRHNVFPVLSESAAEETTMISGRTRNQARLRLAIDNESSGGYRSGRSSYRGTPDTDSTESTRSAGIFPDRRHFCTAWYRTPHLDANGPSPPPPAIARSTTPMDGILQPTVAIRQQPIRANLSDSMQLMVVRTKDEARAEFSRNLNSALDRLEAPHRGRPEWLRKQLNGIVSRESCRKWLSGDDMPDQANMSVLIDRFGLNQQLLRTGKWEPAPSSKDEGFRELEQAWPHLDESAREAVLSVVRIARPKSQSPVATRRRRA